MPHQPGTYLGGIRTVEDLRARCYVDPDTACWHCRMAPQVWVIMADGKRRKMYLRRAALTLRDGPLPAGHLAWAKATCRSDDCANPGHCTSGTKVQWGAALARSGRVKGLPRKIAASRRASIARRALSDAQVAEIMVSTETNREAAKRLGVTENLVKGVRRQERYKPVCGFGSVFAWAAAQGVA